MTEAVAVAVFVAVTEVAAVTEGRAAGSGVVVMGEG